MNKLLSIAVIAFSPLVYSQGQQSADDALTEEIGSPPQDDQKYPQQILEEITVRGERTFFSIRSQIRMAEDDMYALFNELNSNDDFDIICRERKRLSHIPRRECEPMFLTKARRANAVMGLANMREGFSSIGNETGTVGDFSAGNTSSMFEYGLEMIQSESELKSSELTNFEALQAEMLKIATENPKFLEELMRVGKLKQILSEERMKEFGIP